MKDIYDQYRDYKILGKFLIDSALNGSSDTTISREEIGDFLVPWGLGCIEELDEEWPEFKNFIEMCG